MNKIFLIVKLMACAAILNAQPLTEKNPIADLTQLNWQYVAFANDSTVGYPAVMNQTEWGTIKTGRRWELQNHAELNEKTVWIKTTFYVPKNLQGHTIRFFCTAIDDEANFYINHKHTAQEKYKWHIVAKHTDVDLTQHIEYGKENTLVIQVIDYTNTIRKGGIIGSVFLYSTLPFTRTPDGGIRAENNTADAYSVILHSGEALLSSGNKTTFTSSELSSAKIPSYILRADEAIILTKAKDVGPQKFPYRVDLEKVNKTIDDRALELKYVSFPEKIAQYDQIEMAIDLKAAFTNPFDPRQVNLQAVITTPSNRVEKVPGYFRQDFERIALNEEEELLLPKKNIPWIVKYRPREKGIYKVELVAQDRSGIKILKPSTFEATPSSAKGYINVSKRNPSYFEFNNGDPFYGIGPSGWYRGPNYIYGGNPRWVPTQMMDAYYQKKAANHSNFEYLPTFYFGRLLLQDGTIDQHTFWKLEHVLEKMESLGIYWIVFHDDIRRFYDYAYDNGFLTMPYSAKNGGPAHDLMEVYFNEDVLSLQKNQVRYLIGRISDSPAVWLWNFGDEVQPGNQKSSALVRTWLKELHAYARNMDVYQHPHAIGEDAEGIQNGSDVAVLGGWYITDKDQPNKHCEYHNQYDISAAVDCILDEYKNLEMPIILPEGGLCEWKNNYYISGEKWDFEEMMPFHLNLWHAFFRQAASSGSEWMCNVIDRDSEWYHAEAFYQYIKEEPLTSYTWKQARPESNSPSVRAYALVSSEKSLVWLQNTLYNWYQVGYLKQEFLSIPEAQIKIPVEKEGRFIVEFWDTRNGKIIKRRNATSHQNIITIDTGQIEKDIALKVIFEK